MEAARGTGSERYRTKELRSDGKNDQRAQDPNARKDYFQLTIVARVQIRYYSSASYPGVFTFWLVLSVRSRVSELQKSTEANIQLKTVKKGILSIVH